MTRKIIVIGGGPSGLMAAIAAAQAGADVLLLDKGDKLGRKLAISGGGRCNVTNAKELDELIKHIPGNGRFLYSALTAFGNQQIMQFFTDLGIALKEEDRGRMFPVSDKAKTVVDSLLAEVRRLGVQIRTHARVAELVFRSDCGGRRDSSDDKVGDPYVKQAAQFESRISGVRLADQTVLEADAVIVAVGGQSVPQTGSTGDGYPWARAAGHTVTELYPTEVPIRLSNEFIRQRTLQGLSLRNIELTVWNPKGKRVKTHEGDIIFTHFGISGPAALRCSQYVVKTMKSFHVSSTSLTLDLLPDATHDQLTTELQQICASESKKSLKNNIKSLFQRYSLPERFIETLLATEGANGDATFPQISRATFGSLTELLKQFPLTACGTLSLEEAFITGGGVSVKEIDPKTMASKMMPGLYFCGEILDIHGYTGGYNITAAFSTGHCAGRSAAAYVICKSQSSSTILL